MAENDKNKLYGMNGTEAWFDAKEYEPDTHVNIPHEEAVEEARAWVEDNQK